MNNDRIADIRARCGEATPGPWGVGGVRKNLIQTAEAPFFEVCVVRGGSSFQEVGGEQKANTNFVVHAREDIPYLLEQLGKVEAEVDRLHGLLAERNVLLDKQDEELATLREAQQKKGCEYCLEVSLEDCKSWEIWGGKSVDIRFCPMCGRRLEGSYDKR